MDTIQDRLRAAIKEAGLKPVDVARELDITPQAVNSWFATGAIGKDKLSKLAALTNRSTDWFIQGDTVPKAPNSDYIDVRFYEHAVLSAGHGANNDGHGAPRTVPVPRRLLPADVNPDDIVVVPVKGTSMSGEIEDGAYAFVHTRDKTRFKNGKIYAFNQGEDTLVKFFFNRVGGGILIKAKNEDEFPTQTVPPYDLGKLDVIGRVIASINRYWTGPGGG